MMRRPEKLNLYTGQRGVREAVEAASFVAAGYREFGGGIMAINYGKRPADSVQ